MIRSPASSAYDPLIRQAHVERARYIESLLQRGLALLQHALERAVQALRAMVATSSDAAYLAHARNHADLKRRYLIVEHEHARVAPDAGR